MEGIGFPGTATGSQNDRLEELSIRLVVLRENNQIFILVDVIR